MISLQLYLFILIELIFVSIGDVKNRKIPNMWVITNIVVSIFLFILFPNMYELRGETFQFPIVFIFVGFLLFQLKVMGGGDSKYLASFFLLVPYSYQDKVFSYLLLSTILIGCASFINSLFQEYPQFIKSLRDRDLQGVKKCFGTKFAFAPVILITWILTGWDLREELLKLIMN